jgi:hypothetical protein
MPQLRGNEPILGLNTHIFGVPLQTNLREKILIL